MAKNLRLWATLLGVAVEKLSIVSHKEQLMSSSCEAYGLVPSNSGPFLRRLGHSLGIQSYSQLMIGVSNHLLSIVFRFHYHSQKVIGSLGIVSGVNFGGTRHKPMNHVGMGDGLLVCPGP